MATLLNAIFNRAFHYILFVLLLGFSFKLFSQHNPNRTVLVYFTEGVNRIERGNANATIKSSQIGRLLEYFKMDTKNIVSAFPDFDEKDTLKILHDGKAIKLSNRSKIFKILLNDAVNREELIDSLKKNPSVLYAEPDGYASEDLIPSDNRFSEQWNLNNTGQISGTPDADIDAPEAWNIFTGSSSIKIGIIDKGVDRNHPDLSGKVSGSTTLYENHGTHVAGIAAAKANNWYNSQYYGVVGVDWNAQIISKAFDNAKASGDAYLNQIIHEAVNEGANVLNNSWKLLYDNGQPGRYSTTVRIAFADAYKLNVVVAASSGNTGDIGNIYQYPAGFGQGIIAVAATDHNDVRADFSTYQNYVDVSAPGVNILSTINGTGFDSYSGTSMATPHVSGIASLLKGYNSALYNDDIENIIRISTDDKGSSGWDQYYGTGRVNAYRALQFLQTPYQLSQLTASGGSDYSSTGTYNTVIYGANGLADGVYIVKRHEVRKTVSFSPMYDHYAWGRGVGTNGWSLESPNYAMGFCEVVPGTLTANSATLRTYVYEVWNILGQWIGWFPTTASNVSLNYTVLGKQLIAPVISSFTQTPNPIPPGETGTVTAVLSQGNGPITYSWSYANKPTWVSVSFSGNTAYVSNDLVLAKTSATEEVMAPPFSLTCTASNGAGSSTQTYYPALSSTLAKDLSPKSGSTIITEYKLEPNFPNPFNPSTVIKYQIKDKVPVTLKVYDIMGKEVQTLVNTVQESGYYEVTFNGENLSSGIYFYTINAGKYFASRKMLLIK